MFAAALLSCGALTARAQDAPADIKPDHWAYAAVEDLAKKGLIKGYPPDGKFLGGRTLTRYEAATILKRVLDRMDEIVKQSQPGNGVTKEDIENLRSSAAEIRRLVDDLKTQLTVIGADMIKASSDLAALRKEIGDVGARVGAIDDKVSRLSARVDETTLRTDQAIHGVAELRGALQTGLSKKVDVGVGRLRVGGEVQVWFGTAFGSTLGGNTPGSPLPQGRNFGGGVGDTFRLRRAKIILDGTITDAVNYHTMIDVARTGTGSNGPLQDLWVGYKLNRYLRFEIGQQKTGLTEEGTREDSQLLTIARAIMNEDLPAAAGRVGNARDTGAVLKLNASRVRASVGLWNDNGNTINVVDDNRLKFLTGTLFVSTLRHFTFGVWGGSNVGSQHGKEIRDRFGGTLLFQGGPHTFETEAAYARDIAPGTDPNRPGSIAVGFYALYGYRVSRKWQIVFRYDVWDPAQHDRANSTTESGVFIPQANHKTKEYTFGITYVPAQGSKIQLNYIREDVEVNGGNFFGAPRTILLTNFQTNF